MANRTDENLIRRVRSALGTALGARHAGEQLPSSLAEDDEELLARREQTRQNWLLASVLFIGGGVGAIPPDALHSPAHPPAIYLLPLLAIVSGVVCWLIAGRAPRQWLHVTAVVATLEIALTVGLADQRFSAYYTFIAIFVAYVFRDRRWIAAHIGFAALLSFAPLLYADETARDGLVAGFDPRADVVHRRHHRCVSAGAARGQRGALPRPLRARPADRRWQLPDAQRQSAAGAPAPPSLRALPGALRHRSRRLQANQRQLRTPAWRRGPAGRGACTDGRRSRPRHRGPPGR